MMALVSIKAPREQKNQMIRKPRGGSQTQNTKLTHPRSPHGPIVSDVGNAPGNDDWLWGGTLQVAACGRRNETKKR